VNPTSQLNEIVTIARRLLDNWTDYEHTEAALANATVPSTGIGVGGGDVPDPLYASALSHEHWDETCGELSEALGHLRNVDRRVASTNREHPATARLVDSAVRAARCREAVCEDLAVTSDGRCYRCWLNGAA
jgi:hypothetical protein